MPSYRFTRTGAGGKATLIEFIDDQRAAATDATYSSCSVDDDSSEPAWILKASELRIDHETNEGVAHGAVLRFYGVPILAAPVMSFPLTDERKSGFLPPSFGIDSQSGFQVAIPYYWNIAPNRDATFTPQVNTRRGAALETEFRYLEPAYFGSIDYKVLPNDRQAERSRYSLRADHEGNLPYGAYAQLRVMHVSDDDYWKDFPGELKTSTPRLLQTDLLVTRPFGDWTTYARTLQWQVLQTVDPTTRIDSPYERAPQIGTRYAGPFRAGFDVSFETELNRFADPQDRFIAPRQTGVRARSAASRGRSSRRAGTSRPSSRSTRRATRSTCRSPMVRAARRASSRPSASTALGRSSATRAFSAARCARRSSRACSTSTRRTGPSKTCRTSTLRPRTSTSIPSSPRTRSRGSTASPTRTS
jgi:LPS-assembly protein